MNLSPREALQLIHPDLLIRMARGDHKALEQVYDQTGSVLFTLAVRILGEPREAADLVEQIYLDLWRKSVRYDPRRGTPMVWLMTLTRNRAVERLRTRSGPARPRTEEKDIPAAERDPAPMARGASGRSPSDHSSSAPLKGPAGPDDLRSTIAQALGSLSDAQKQALDLAYFQGWTYQDIAARQNENPERVKAGLIAGLHLLKITLGTSWEQDTRDGTRSL